MFYEYFGMRRGVVDSVPGMKKFIFFIFLATFRPSAAS